LAETGIGYRLLDSLYAPSTLHDPSAHRSIPILAARRLDPSNLVELDAVVGSIHSITPPVALLMPVWLPREVSVILLSGPLSSVLVIVGREVVRRSSAETTRVVIGRYVARSKPSYASYTSLQTTPTLWRCSYGATEGWHVVRSRHCGPGGLSSAETTRIVVIVVGRLLSCHS